MDASAEELGIIDEIYRICENIQGWFALVVCVSHVCVVYVVVRACVRACCACVRACVLRVRGGGAGSLASLRELTRRTGYRTTKQGDCYLVKNPVGYWKGLVK